MALPKTKKMLISGCLLMSLILCSCGGQSLAEREIVRGVLFTRQGAFYSACLVLADQNAPEGTDGNKISAARGSTPAQALAKAEQSLQGEVYYGLLDLVALPGDADLSVVRSIGELLYQNAQPAPELSVFALDSDSVQSWAEEGSVLYRNMKAMEKTYKIHCGLQQLFSQEDACCMPVYQSDAGYDFLLLAENDFSIRCTGLQAQLAAVLCGQASAIRETIASGRIACEARTQVLADQNKIQIHLRDTALTALEPSVDSVSLEQALRQAFQESFASLRHDTEQTSADLFHFHFWQASLYGPAGSYQTPTLEVFFD